MKQRKILHLLDDVAMGGVTRALKNFEDPALQACGTHETLDVTKIDAKAQSRGWTLHGQLDKDAPSCWP